MSDEFFVRDPDDTPDDTLAVQSPDVAETSEGAQELATRNETPREELRREVGAVLRIPEGGTVDASDIDFERPTDETMIINMGPQHPSTHGVLRLMLELDGETVLRTKPVIGYLHTGMEKTGEELTYVQGGTNVTRMDYLSPLNNELVFAMATEALLDVELPPRAIWIRMLMSELQRTSSHLMWMATNGMDLGSTSMMIYGFREREMILAFFKKTTGLRMNHNYIRPGGVAADLPDGWEDDITVICDTILARSFEYDELLTGQPIFRERTEGVGALSAEEALALSLTGPILRSTGVSWDLRKAMPYLAYDQLDFDQAHPPDRRAHAAGRLPGAGPQGHPTPPGPDRRVDGGPDPPLQDLHGRVPGARGRGVHRHRITPGRAGLLPGLRRHLQALPAAHPRAQLRQPAVRAGPVAWRPHRRRRGHRVVDRPGDG
jgi:Respiratory-chain NADH dehydrogenase, 49 Kd subunit